MIARIIDWSVHNRPLVLLATLFLVAAGLLALKDTAVDAIPDLSDVQVIIRTPFAGQAPRVVEEQVTYPLSTAMLAVPGAASVRGYSFFGDSYVYILFEDGTDPYWARSRVLESLSQVAPNLPDAARPALGPDATGVGWVYEYALVDRSGQHDLSQLTSLQNWFLKYELQTVEGVAEVATVGGMVRQYQVVVDPDRLRALNMPLAQVRKAIQSANQEAGGAVVEMAEAEYMVRATGYLRGVDDLKAIPLRSTADGVVVSLADVAEIQIGPQLRRGIAELNGQGEVVGGIIVMRYGGNAQATIERVKHKLEQLSSSLPDGVQVVPVYDRSELIGRAVDNLYRTLLEEFLVVALVCAVFLFHLRSALVAIVSLPVGILVAFLIMRWQGLNANIMSLGGIAIAIGAMVDAAIVMIENLHKHMERKDDARTHWQRVVEASSEVGPPLFFSLLIITLSFLPVFTLEAQEGRLFTPLAYTKTYAMAVSAGLAITLVPVLMGYFVRGRIRAEQDNPINRILMRLYTPVIRTLLRAPWLVVGGGALAVLATLYPATRLGSEFMPPLDEGDWMYMPTTRPGISIGKARQVLQQTDKLIKSVPEVDTVFGKIGRAETATDPAPLTMIETTITFKPQSEWREGMTLQDIREEIKQRVQLPGVTNAWVMPIKTRIDMLATGIKTPVGIKIGGSDLAQIQAIGRSLEALLPQLPGTASVYAERVAGGRYITVDIDRQRAGRLGLNIDDVQAVVRSAIGGMNVTQTVEGLERYPVNLRYPQSLRDSVQAIDALPIVTPGGAQVALGDVAEVRVEDGPPMIKSENARLSGWVFVDIQGRDVGSYVREAQALVERELKLPPGYALSWSGQYEYMQRAKQKLALVVPATLAVITLLLFLAFRSFAQVAIILGTVPLALIGGVWLLFALGYPLSVAVGVGFIALAGVAVEIGVVMLVYLNMARARLIDDSRERGHAPTLEDWRQAVADGARLRLRPVVMTTATLIFGLLPVMLSSGTGSEIMHRIAAPLFGGAISALLLSLLVMPCVYLLWVTRGARRE
ncbi:cation efflux system transmembrane protein [Oceanococcus atlanticus]|uniref:Cation efflux system transmembrane protein n=1 Tax=Oceanococcus atlanticus TaxID=1317117 RepID=A0A1Y1SDJ6_9GAMM|nr:CusA/CzcA family heavy metal efflux RND transporter [Oceanococcus atlanticus]ORE87075.1 cation efflux system transmembrane protein [Oceanococcus atlanticus]